MPAATPIKRPVKVGQLVRRRLKELKRTPRELAEALQVTERYIAELVSGRRLPPAPSRADVYAPMTKFLRLHRNDLPTCARAEREGEGPSKRRPSPRVREMLLELSHPDRTRALSRRLLQRRGPALDALVAHRLLEVAQGFVRRQLDDEVGIRVAASRDGCTYLELRMKLLEFLDRTPSSLTPADVEDFIRPRIGTWDIDFETQTMRIVLRAQEVAPRQKRALAI
jgi:transcriptional regulator with XRE-family HTH domain